MEIQTISENEIKVNPHKYFCYGKLDVNVIIIIFLFNFLQQKKNSLIQIGLCRRT